MLKDPPLDLVGWWSTTPPSGPDTSQLPIQQQLLQHYNEAAVFLAFHPSQLQSPSDNESKLPLTIYESVYEADSAQDADKQREMQIDAEQSLGVRFRELSYSVETGEAEMISTSFVARGGGNAAVTGTQKQKPAQVHGKGKKVEKAPAPASVEESETVLSPDEEDSRFISFYAR